MIFGGFKNDRFSLNECFLVKLSQGFLTAMLGKFLFQIYVVEIVHILEVP